MAGVKYLEIRVTRHQPHCTRRQSRIFDGHCTRPLANISVTGHWRILSYMCENKIIDIFVDKKEIINLDWNTGIVLGS